MALASTLSFERLVFSVVSHGADSWIVDVRARLSGGTKQHGTLQLLTARCPLTVRDVKPLAPCDVYSRSAPSGTAIIEIVPRTEMIGGWHGVDLEFQLLWEPTALWNGDQGTAGNPRLGAPCLLLPDMLPVLVEVSAPLGGAPPDQLPRIFFASELPPALNAGGVSVPNWRGKATPELLQAVVYVRSAGAPDFDNLGVGAVSAVLSRAACEEAYEYAAPLLDFVDEGLATGLPVRPVLFLVDEEHLTLYPPMGAYCPVRPEDVGAVRRDVGKPVHIVRLLAQSWIGGGVRLWGENSVELGLAIGGALGLRWAEQSREHDHVEQVLDSARHVGASADGGSQMAEDVGALQAHIFQGLQQPSFRRALGKLVRNRWGSYLHQDDLISLLRHFRIPVPGVFA